MKPPKWEPDNPVNKQVEAMFGRKRTKRGFGKYTAKQYRKALEVLRKEKKKQEDKNAKRNSRKASPSF
jgi:hypothetical protein